jgi:hypothetical protein
LLLGAAGWPWRGLAVCFLLLLFLLVALVLLQVE